MDLLCLDGHNNCFKGKACLKRVPGNWLEKIKSVSSKLLQRNNANNNMCSTHHSSPRKNDPSNRMIHLIVSQGEPVSNKSSRVVKEPALNDSDKYNAFVEFTNSRKQPSGAHSLLIRSSTDIVDRKFITDLHDFDMKYKACKSVKRQVVS